MSRPQFSEEELRALEAEMEKLTVDDVLLQTVVTLINLGARKAGLAAPPARGEAGGERSETGQPKRDMDQVKQAIDAARALMPLLEPRHAQQLGPVKDALSRLQMAFVQLSGGQPQPEAPPPPEEPQPQQEGPGPAQRSGRLWVPGQ
jgi:hypothetical protein